MPDSQMPSHHGSGDDAVSGATNETMRLLLERSSCRSFHNRKIPPETLKQVLEAGVHAATGGNLQPYSIIRIDEAEPKLRMAKMCDQNFIGTAPTDLLFCIDYHRLERWAGIETAPFSATASFRHFWIAFQDTIIAAQNICTAADAVGLGSVYIGTVLECFRELREMFDLPDGVFPVVLLCLGWPKTRPAPRRKLGVDVVVHREKYHELDDAALREVFDQKYPSRHKPELRIAATKERLEIIEKVCRQVRGSEFAEACLENIRTNGYINPAQRYFGLHYRANEMPLGNELYLRLMDEFGFTWFREYVARGEAGD